MATLRAKVNAIKQERLEKVRLNLYDTFFDTMGVSIHVETLSSNHSLTISLFCRKKDKLVSPKNAKRGKR